MLFSSSSFPVILLGILTHFLILTPSLAIPRASTASQFKTSSHLSARDGVDPCVEFFTPSNETLFLAEHAYRCLTSVPFDKAIASQFIQYYKDTLEFQSTLAYLKDPPSSYQQPRVDILSALDLIAMGVETGVFRDEYAFEAAVQNVVQAAHDSHIRLDAGVLNVFSFGSPYAISSISMDGIEIPKVYFTEELVASQAPGADSKPSPIKSIGTQDAIEWLTQFAARNSFGLLEPNADWNALMYNPAADIQNKPSAFTGQSHFYPGDKLDFVREDGSIRSIRWRALANVPPDTPSINNGEDVYSFFVLNNFPSDGPDFSSPDPASSTYSASPSTTPASPDDLLTTTATSTTGSPYGGQSSDTPTDTPLTVTDTSPAVTDTSIPSSSDTPASWATVPAYPSDPDIVQDSLGYGGFITGYFLRDSSIAVLSIPSFEMTGSALSSFSETVGSFLKSSKDAGMKKVVIDLQQNYGGEILLATDTFKQFFPSSEPFGGSRLRATHYSDALGNTFTQHQSQNLSPADADALIDIPWAVLDYVDAGTKENFTSWSDFLGHHADRGDLFSKIQQYNLSSSLFDEVATGGYLLDGISPAGIVVYGYGNRSTSTPTPFAAEDVVLLTDSVCHSACAAFVEMMHHEAGVRTTVVGGRPNIGAMQAVAGTRGALAYSSDKIDNDIYQATTFNSSVAKDLPLSHVAESLQFWITHAGINLRDQIRKGETENFPQQFAYEAADCRIYWTYSTFNNFRNLWQYAADATWTNPDLCVKYSRNYHSSVGTDTIGPNASQKRLWSSVGSALPNNAGGTMGSSHRNAAKDNGIASDDSNPLLPMIGQNCDRRTNCGRSGICAENSACRNGQMQVTRPMCKQQCTRNKPCGVDPQFGATFCNIFDLQCSLRKDGTPVCGQQTQSQTGAQRRESVLGSGGQSDTTLHSNQGQSPYAYAGFCQPRLRQADPKCLNALKMKTAPAPPKSSMAALASKYQISAVVEEMPVRPQDQLTAATTSVLYSGLGAAINEQYGAVGVTVGATGL